MDKTILVSSNHEEGSFHEPMESQKKSKVLFQNDLGMCKKDINSSLNAKKEFSTLLLNSSVLRPLAKLNEIYITRKHALIVYFRRAMYLLQNKDTNTIQIYALGLCINTALWLVQDLLLYPFLVKIAYVETRTVSALDKLYRNPEAYTSQLQENLKVIVTQATLC